MAWWEARLYRGSVSEVSVPPSIVQETLPMAPSPAPHFLRNGFAYGMGGHQKGGGNVVPGYGLLTPGSLQKQENHHILSKCSTLPRGRAGAGA